MNRLFKDIVGLFQERAHSKGVTLSCLIQAEVPTWLHGDSGRLRQILRNLLSNAVKFTERGEIVVRADMEKKPDRPNPIDLGLPAMLIHVTGKTGHVVSVRFAVSDTGIGIAQEPVHGSSCPLSKQMGRTQENTEGQDWGSQSVRSLSN